MGFWREGKKTIARWLNLDLTPDQVQYRRLLENHLVKDGIRWLEVGAGRFVIPPWAMPEPEQKRMTSRASALIGLDMDDAIKTNPYLDQRVFGRCEHLPFPADSFDLVSSNMVIEHLEDPGPALREVLRVLKPSGRFTFHTPNYLNYLVFIASFVPDPIKSRIVWIVDRREEKDRFETFYRLNTPATVERLALAAGFEIEEIRTVGSNGSFGNFGIVGWFELIPLKLSASLFKGKLNCNLIAVLRKPAVKTEETIGTKESLASLLHATGTQREQPSPSHPR